MSLRLGLITDRNAFWGDDGLWTNTALARLIAALRSRCDQLHLAISRSPQRISGQDFRLAAENLIVSPLPWYPNAAVGFFRNGDTRRTVRRVENDSDVVIAQLPFAAVAALLGAKKPRVYNICANIRSAVEQSDAHRGFKRIPAVGLARLIDNLQRRLVHAPRTAVVAHGRELLDHYQLTDGVAVVSSSMLPEEVGAAQRRRPAAAPFRILYVGFLRRWKGVDTLFDAYEQLLAHVPDAELIIVGGNDISGRTSTELSPQAVELIERGKIRLVGHVPFGPELFQHYADADVAVVPSRGGEGTPRVLIEARACGCPVIGTTVGGIPESITHEVDGLLIPPNDAAALAAALLRMARDGEFRKQLMLGGLQRAERTTVDHYADVLIEQARRLIPTAPVATSV